MCVRVCHICAWMYCVLICLDVSQQAYESFSSRQRRCDRENLTRNLCLRWKRASVTKKVSVTSAENVRSARVGYLTHARAVLQAAFKRQMAVRKEKELRRRAAEARRVKKWEENSARIAIKHEKEDRVWSERHMILKAKVREHAAKARFRYLHYPEQKHRCYSVMELSASEDGRVHCDVSFKFAPPTPTSVTLGPVIGRVGEHTATIVAEVDSAAVVTCVLTDSFDGTITFRRPMHMEANTPATFVFDGLRSSHRYCVSLEGVHNPDKFLGVVSISLCILCLFVCTCTS